MKRIPLIVDKVAGVIHATHWGYTLRTLFGAAAASIDDAKPGEQRSFTVCMKGSPIATIKVRKHTTLD